MNVGSSFVANAQSAELVQPTDGSFDDPSRCSKAAAMCGADLGKLITNVALTQPARMGATAIGSIALHSIRSAARPARSTSNRRDRFDQRAHLGGVVSICAGENHTQRDALGIGTDVVLAASFASIRRIRSRLEPPKTARTELLSTTARLQSIWPAPLRRSSRMPCSLDQTPACCQSRRRRQQVMPLPQPISLGKSSQPIPVFSTNRIPVSAARLSRGMRPGKRIRRGFTGSIGSIRCHSSSLTSGFAMPSFSLNTNSLYSSFC